MSDATSEPMDVLHVDDDPNLLDLAATVLERESDQLRVGTAASVEDAFDVIADGNVECVVSDYRLPEMDGVAFLKTVREDHPRLPFILFTGEGDENHIDRIVRAHERMDGIIEDVLTLARQGQTVSETEPVVGSEVVTLAWASVKTGEASLRVEWEAVVDADASRLQQLFENLFHNAVEHAGPVVTVRVDELDDGFAVEDDGPGVPEDVRETAFESGYSTAESGTGFGLTIVAGITEAHGWHVSLTEGDEGGARFEFTGVEPAEG